MKSNETVPQQEKTKGKGHLFQQKKSSLVINLCHQQTQTQCGCWYMATQQLLPGFSSGIGPPAPRELPATGG